MQEIVITCDGCNKKVDKTKLPLEMTDCDLCRICIRKLIERQLKQVTLRIDCEECGGEGKLRVIDAHATCAKAACGDDRTQYKVIECDNCFHG